MTAQANKQTAKIKQLDLFSFHTYVTSLAQKNSRAYQFGHHVVDFAAFRPSLVLNHKVGLEAKGMRPDIDALLNVRFDVDAKLGRTKIGQCQ